jgi:hypothetical protein
MKPDDKAADDAVYRACITWNLPALRNSGDDADRFKRTIQLLPSAFNDTTNSAPKRMTPLRRAAEGLNAELTGKTDTAREHYEVVAKKKGLPGVLGALLIAWMSDATEKDFARVERKLATLTGPGTRDVIARSHCKLATWAYDNGWRAQSAHHFEEARRQAGKDLRMMLDRIGHWFGGDLVFYMNQTPTDMTTFPWIDEWVDGAARNFVEKSLRDSVKSPYTRGWSFGASTVEGHDIQSAEMQASWAGALWMLPQIHRQHAALILAKSNEPDDVARAIGLWAKGGGKDTNRLVSVKEPVLTESTIEDLLGNQLHEGRSVRDRDTWLDILHALWAELPDRFVEDFVSDYAGPIPGMSLHGDTGTKELGLFGKLLVRSGRAVEKVYGFSEWEAGLLARSMHPELLNHLPRRLLARLLAAGISEPVLANEDWSGTGWASLLACWTLLDQDAQAEYRDAVLEALPDSAVTTAVVVAPGLVTERRSDERLRVTVRLLAKELKDSRSGSFTGWGTHPAIDLARLATARGHISDSAVQRLVAIAVAPTTIPMQRLPCLTALTALAQDNLIERAQVERAFRPVSVHSVMTDDAGLDQRLEDIARLTLMVQFGYEQATAEAPLLAASRDSDVQIRILAVDAVSNLSVQGHISPSFDATLLGALYDPNPQVQARAVPALWHGHFESAALLDVARSRVAETFPTAHRELRAAIAHQIADIHTDDPSIQRLRRLATHDRSWVVRRAVSRAKPQLA